MKEKTIYALGFFDGVHLGHQALLSACRDLAAEAGCKAGVITFGSHPDGLVLGSVPGLISTLQERQRLLQSEFHMDAVVILPFDRNMMDMPWADFYRMLCRNYGAAGFVCGEDFRFGRGGMGTAETLARVCAADGLVCRVVPQRRLDGVVISSTHIRALLEQGEMEEANRFLGRPYTLTGTVVPGKQLGRRLGIPTANLLFPSELAPLRFGVYACIGKVDGQQYHAVTNIGTRPTVSGAGVTVEPWLLDFEGDLYGSQVTLEFFKFLRPERKFPDVTALQQEIFRDRDQTNAYFESCSKGKTL